MKISRLVVASAFAHGLGGAASASQLGPRAADILRQPGIAVDYVKNKGHKGHKGWKGNKGHHYGWDRGRHRGWYKPRSRSVVYFRF